MLNKGGKKERREKEEESKQDQTSTQGWGSCTWERYLRPGKLVRTEGMHLMLSESKAADL